MSRWNSGAFGYVVSYIFSRSYKKKPRDPISGGNPLYGKNDLIIMFIFIVLLGSSFIVQIVWIDLPVVIFIKVKHWDEGLFISVTDAFISSVNAHMPFSI